MAKGTADLRILILTLGKPLHAKAFDDYCDDWIDEDKVRQARFMSLWAWRSLPWQLVLFDPDYTTAAALDPNGELEGLVAIRPATASASAPLVLEYCQTAPRNFDVPATALGKDALPGLRRGVGTAMLRWAVFESQRLGARGAITLASLKEAEPFYDGLNFAETGKSPNGRKIYTLSVQEVANFMARTKVRSAGKP